MVWAPNCESDVRSTRNKRSLNGNVDNFMTGRSSIKNPDILLVKKFLFVTYYSKNHFFEVPFQKIQRDI